MRILSIKGENYGSLHGEFIFHLADRGLTFVYGENQDEPRMNSNGCLTGDTLIDCPRNLKKYPKGIPIRKLVGKRPWVYSWDGERIVVRRASKVWLTKKRARVVRVRLTKYATKRGAGQGGKYLPQQELVGTADHPVLLVDGITWKALGDLAPGDRLCSLYRRESGGWRTLLHWTGSGEMPMGSSVGQRTVSEQQFVCEETHGPRPDGTEVHHINENPWDHSPANLEWKEGCDHRGEHIADRNRKGLAGWKVSGVHPKGMAGKGHSDATRSQISKTMKKEWVRRKKNGINHTVLGVESAGYRDVYDMRVPGVSNFVANGVVVHNSGKSTMFDFPDWVLFGVVPKDDHVDSIVNDEATTCKGVCYLDDDGVPLTVEREKTRGKSMTLKFWKGQELVQALDTKETQRLLELELGLDREVFHSTVLYGQTEVFHFADSKSDAARMEILTKILQLGDLDVWLENAKERVKEIGNVVASKKFELEQTKGKIAALEGQSFQMESGNWENERAESLRAAVQQLDDFKTNIAQAEANLELEDKIRAMASVLDPMGATVYDWTEFDRPINQARDVENQWIASQATLEAEGKALKSRRTALGAGVCSECGQAMPDQAHIAKETERLTTEIKELRGRYKQGDASLQQAKAASASAVASKEAVRLQHVEADKDLARRATEAQSQLRSIQESKDYLAKAHPHVDRLHGVMATTHAKTNPWLKKEEDRTDQLRSLQATSAQILETIDTEIENSAYYEFWVKGFGIKGLKSYIIDQRLQEMTDAANEWVKLLTGGTFWIRFETQTPTAKKKLSNKINIRVFHYRPDGSIRERGYRSYSGGQKKRISWAIDFGLSRLIAARALKTYDLMILDEVFKHVDSAGAEAVVEMLHHLRREKSSIFVIEQDAAFQSHFENRVKAQLKNGRTTILEESDVQQATKKEVAPGPASADGVGWKKKSKRAPRRKRPPSRKPVQRKRRTSVPRR